MEASLAPAPPASAPDPAVLAVAIEQAMVDHAPVATGTVNESFSPVVAVVNRLLEDLAESRKRLERAEDEATRRAEEVEPEPASEPRPAVEVRDLPLPALLAGRDLGLLDANEAFRELSGLSREALLGMPLSRFVRRREGDPPVLSLRRGASTKATVSLDTVNGEAGFVEHASPVRNSAGEVEGLVVVYAPEPILPESKGDGYARLFEALMHEAPLPIALLDASFRVLDHTPAFGALLGVDDAWLRDHPLTDLSLVEETGPALDEIVDRGEEAFGEVVVGTDGERRRLERYVLPVRDDGGRLFRLLVTFMDRTDSDLQADRIAVLEERAASLQEEDGVQWAALEQALLRLGEGDLDQQLDSPPGGRFGALATSFNLAIEHLKGRIATLEAQALVHPDEPAPDTESIMLMSAAEITGLLLGAIGGEQGERLLLDEADPLMPLRVEVNEALDRLEAMTDEPDDMEPMASEPPLAPVERTGPEIPAPDTESILLMSAAEITGLLLGAIGGEQGERLLLDEANPLMPLRVEVNEALDRLEAATNEPDDMETMASAPPVAPVERSGDEIPAPAPEPVPLPSPDDAFQSTVEPDLLASHQPEPEPPSTEEIILTDLTVQSTTPPSPEVTPALPIELVPLSGVDGEPTPFADNAMDLGVDVEVVTFEMAGQQYALDIRLAREIVEMIPITPIPRSPSHITGIINLRGEITTILNLYQLLGLPDPGTGEGQKIVVLVPEAADGSNVGIIVDNVHSVNQVPAHRIELKGEGSSADYTGFVRGIIRQDSSEGEEDTRNLVIWIDMPAILEGLIAQSS